MKYLQHYLKHSKLIIVLSLALLSSTANAQKFNLYLNGFELNDTHGKLIKGVHIGKVFVSAEKMFADMKDVYTWKDENGNITFTCNLSPDNKSLSFFSQTFNTWMTYYLSSQSPSTYTFIDEDVRGVNLVLLKDFSALIIVDLNSGNGNEPYQFKAIFREPILVKGKN